MKLSRKVQIWLYKRFRIRVWKWDNDITITSKYFYISIRNRQWYLLPTICVEYRPWNSKGERYLVFFYWLNFMIRNE